MLEWRIGNNLDESELRKVSDGVLKHGRALAVAGNATPIACLVYKDGSVIAGGTGRTEFNRLYVQYLWVDEQHRAQGIGTEILKRLEALGSSRGCTDALIETLNDQAFQLYLRLNYVPISTLPNYVGHFTRHTLLKSLP
ncbi:GNAT family N-acetyltransferase [Pseudomonas chlororaphis]|uniref:GNAT family N-acetyltransferase n=1 Tax=Pseudomonas chlororaphis TaxID=587753 RepID=UPI0009B87FDF|nr:GNAT family N-acetyltransferase [Pseudomonas chlororaphis]